MGTITDEGLRHSVSVPDSLNCRQSELVCYLVLDGRALEKARVGASVQAGGVGERELAKVLLFFYTINFSQHLYCYSFSPLPSSVL